MEIDGVGEWWMWAGFFAITLVLVAVNLLLMRGREDGAVSQRTAAVWTGVWIAVSMLFAAGLWLYLSRTAGEQIANQRTMEFITGYLIELALAVDNVFVWIVIFNYFSIPAPLQQRVLSWGVLGAIVMRMGFIFAGVILIKKFHWILYIFGAFLIYTGIKMLGAGGEKPDIAHHPALRWMERNLRLTPKLYGHDFFIRVEGKLTATTLFLALVLVEISDVVFAADSIPAIFAITTDPFIVLTSNIFAIMGLRAMYFLTADMVDRFSLLHYGLSFVMAFIGVKMLLVDVVKIPIGISLAIVGAAIGVSMIMSLRLTARKNAERKEE